MSDTDALFDTSEPAMSLRIARFKSRCAECPIERALMGLTLAVEDLDGALILAQSPEALATIRDSAEDAIKRLIILSSTALTLAQLMEKQQ